MRFDILTLFPSLFDSPFADSLLGKAQKKNLLSIRIHDIRQYTKDKHKKTDDIPYGGGPGMVMTPEPIVECLTSVVETGKKCCRIYLSPQGRVLKQSDLASYLDYDQIVLLCGRYEGVDERVIENFIDEEISIGDYVLSGGELPAMVFVEALSRLIPGVLGAEESLQEESHTSGLLEYPQYTRPPDFRGHKVPEILLSGDHQKIEAWRRQQALERTRRKRPDLK